MSESRKTEKKERREQLERHIREVHDLQDGQVRQWQGCGETATDVCAICGLRVSWSSGGLHGEFGTSYSDAKGNPLTLGEAARLPCL